MMMHDSLLNLDRMLDIYGYIMNTYIYILYYIYIYLKPPGLGLLGHTYVTLLHKRPMLIRRTGGESIVGARTGGTRK